MLPILLFLGIAVPAIELTLLILISQWCGFWWTVGLIVFTGVIGALLWRWQGFGVFGKFRSTMMMGGLSAETNSSLPKGKMESPVDILMDGAMIFFAGGLLLTPGVLTDLLGFALLIPPTRSLFKKALKLWIKSRMSMVDVVVKQGSAFGGSFQNATDNEEDILEGEIVSYSTREESEQAVTPPVIEHDPNRPDKS